MLNYVCFLFRFLLTLLKCYLCRGSQDHKQEAVDEGAEEDGAVVAVAVSIINYDSNDMLSYQ